MSPSNFSLNVVARTSIQGVAGDLVIVRRNRRTVSKQQKVDVKVGDTIGMAWRYGIRMQRIPSAINATSDSSVLRFCEIRRLVPAEGRGRGVLMAFFQAIAVGSTRAGLVIHERDEVIELGVDVEVSGR
jgi:hypothetical protein